MKNCNNCEYCIFEMGIPTDCTKLSDMTEEEAEKYWSNAESGCPKYQEDKMQI